MKKSKDEDPDVAELTDLCRDNHTTCVSDKIDALKEVFDEKTCLDMLTNYYSILSKLFIFRFAFRSI